MSQFFLNNLNYTIGNEDVELELSVLPENSNHVFAIGGSGSRIIPLLSKEPKHLTCVDSSAEQLSVAELRIASIAALDRKEFLSFWGYPGCYMSPSERKEIFNKLKLSNHAEKMGKTLLEKNNWNPLLYFGKWEQSFRKISKAIRLIVGRRGYGIFESKTMSEQEKYLKTKFPQRSWSTAVFLLGNSVVFNALLYKGGFPRKNIQETYYKYYSNNFNNLFRQDLMRKNFFLQLLFFGELKFSEGLPIECQSDIYNQAKKGLKGVEIKYILGDAIYEAKNSSLPIDFLSLSDVPSYLKPPQEQRFLQEIIEKISPGGIVVNRYYLRIPEGMDLDGYEDITNYFRREIKKEKIQMYSFGIFRKYSP